VADVGKSIVLAGGGTAGHVNPLLATAAELVARGHTVRALGTAEGLESDLVPRAGVELHTIDRVPLPRSLSAAAMRFPAAFRRARLQAGAVLDAHHADVVVGFGGFVSTPAYAAARKRRIPVVVHEANARPGFANRYGARFAAVVAITFPGTPLPRAVLTGLPLRAEIGDLAAALADPGVRGEIVRDAREARGWTADAHVLLVTGGSLGAASINAAVAAAAPTLVHHGVHIIHLTGPGKDTDAARVVGDLPVAMRGAYQVAEYAHDMADCFAAASAVVCRAGAATVSEVSALALPALYIPLPHGNGEQALNASFAVEVGAATLLADEHLTTARLILEAERIVLDREAAQEMAAAAASIAIADGATRLADLIEGVA